jgi:hypothetical protein
MSSLKPTTQKAPLEKFLAKQRTKQILPYISRRSVLDFGCGQSAWNAQSISGRCHSIVGVEPTIGKAKRIGAVKVYSSLSECGAENQFFDIVIALAVFEHINPKDLQDLLVQMCDYTSADSKIIGTVPTPAARPVLEFLSYRLGLIDPTQIRDHKVYYDNLWWQQILQPTPWKMTTYKTFQLGLNSFFVLERK